AARPDQQSGPGLDPGGDLSGAAQLSLLRGLWQSRARLCYHARRARAQPGPLRQPVMSAAVWLLGALAALALGVGVGSAVAHGAARLPLDAPLLGPPVCLRTRRRLPWADAVPIWGYLRRRGRCRECGERLP